MSVCTNVLKLQGGNFSELIANIDQNVMLEILPEVLTGWDQVPWLWAVFGSLLIGLSGVLPLLVIPIDETNNLRHGDSANTLKTLLSFAVGGLLGDIFLHSLPEIWANTSSRNGGISSTYNGLLILSGLMVFVIAEKLFSVITKLSENENNEKLTESVNNNINGYDKTNTVVLRSKEGSRITGYLNLLANSVDNFTHGLSVGGAFLVSLRLGCLTTFAILVHEVPHEVGDFAILLKSGFSRWDAAKGQLLTAGGGLVGALVSVFCSGASNSLEARTSWILPFTSGTFLHIALVTVLPDLLKEEDPKESIKQLLALLLGVAIMGFVGVVIE
ncbi:hypothetical protein RN001_011793 [Aquatica leii]|uniref:Solute carrier family 39 member 13 n=1 Tax=Aquatica leii TaxID=1421715 RepID=A0AAN7S7J4_9COLE|nr:hypothetical protein RN001_011793 [Aquatica leii]